MMPEPPLPARKAHSTKAANPTKPCEQPTPTSSKVNPPSADPTSQLVITYETSIDPIIVAVGY